MDRTEVYEQVRKAVGQLHSNGFAHCDICAENIFVDSVEDGGALFIGDLEYCRNRNEKPPPDTRRADARAKTAEQLDNIQLENLKDELAKL
jgi:hypothetical protein